MTVEKLLELREKIGDEPIIPDAEDTYEVMQMMKQPQTMEEMQAAAKLNTKEDPEYSARYKAPARRPLREGGALAEQAENVRQAGRYGDTELMHVTPEEAKGLSSLRGGVTLNPDTNLPEAFFPLAIPAAAAAMSAAPIAAGTAAAIGGTALASGLAASGPLGFGPLTVAQAAAPGFLGYGAGPLAGLSTVPSYLKGSVFAHGSSPFLNGILNTANDVWTGFKGLNSVLQGAVEGAMTAPLTNAITGEETDAEDLFTGAVLGATTAGIRGKSFLGDLGGETELIPSSSVADAGKEVAEKSLVDRFASGLEETVKDPKAWLAGGLALGPSLLAGQQEQQALAPLEEPAPFKPADPQFPMRPILTDPETGEDRFSEESIVRRVVAGEGDDRGLGRQLTDPFTDPDAEIEVAQAAGGGLASLGRGEDNAEYGGEVAHISAEEADLLRRRGGAGTINPDTGLREYFGGAGFHSGQYGKRVVKEEPGTYEHYQRYGTWGSTRGDPSSAISPGSMGYIGRYGVHGDPTRPSDPKANPHLRGNTYGLYPENTGSGEVEEEAKVFNPFTSNLADFVVEDRLARILGSGDTGPTTPIFVPSGSGTATPISDAPTGIPRGDAALEDLLARFRAKRDEDDPIVTSVAPAVEGSYRGGLVSLAHGGEPIGQNTPVFEGQVPMNGDGMDDEIPYKVIPQDPEDAPNTPDIALLSSDEYVLPADVVSMLGNGSSNAGAAALDRFSKLVRKKAHGTNKQQTELNEDKELANLI